MRGWWLLVCAVWFLRVDAAVYVVAPGGDDSWAGSEAKPWKTLVKASRSVEAPKLGADGRPGAGSAALDAGLDVKEVAVDAAGIKRRAGSVDVGAYEGK